MSVATGGLAESGMPSIEWLCDGVERDRSHVLVLCVAPAASSANAPSLLARRYANTFDVVSASLAELEPAAALAQILDDREAMSVASLETRLLQRVEALSARGSAMLLALSDATSIPAATLRRLGSLASASNQGLRLALFADCTEDSVDRLAASLVRDLGVGVEKIVVGMSPGQNIGSRDSTAGGPADARHLAARRGPPRIQHEPLPWWARGRVIRVRAPGRHRHGHSAVWLGVGFIAALLFAWWMRPDFASLVRWAESPEDLEIPRVAESNTAAGARVDESPRHTPPVKPAANELPAAVESEPRSIAVSDLATGSPNPSASLTMAPVGLAPTEPESPPAPVAQVQTISVNLNADPWAHVELDGRSIGSTPLADVPIALGSHRVVLRFPDGLVLERTVEVDAFSRYLRFP